MNLHFSVLSKEVEQLLDVGSDDFVVDCTLGYGGHSLDILEKMTGKGKLIAFDQDERNLKLAKERLKDFDEKIVYINDNFRYLKTRINGLGIEKVDKFLFDLGLSSMHVDDPLRGFSFLNDGPLDMRFNVNDEKTAFDVINSYSEQNLFEIFRDYGEERFAYKYARMIVSQRNVKKFETTKELADFIEMHAPWPKNSSKKSKKHPATQVFQAIRIEVNDELNALKDALKDAFELLSVSGRIVVITFHSLEDRIVKQFFKNLAFPKAEGDESVYSNFSNPKVNLLTKKPIIPSEEEILINPRSRSAKLRAIEKI